MDPNLTQAAQSNDVVGALQKLLLSRIPSPGQEQDQRDLRQERLGQYQEALRADPFKGHSAIDQGLYSWIRNAGGGIDTPHAVMRGVADSGDYLAKGLALKRAGEVAATKAGYEDLLNQDKLSAMELNSLIPLARAQQMASLKAGKQPSPEQLRTVYNTALNQAAQVAKEVDWTGKPPEVRQQWITQQANKAVQNYLQNFATQPTGPRGVESDALSESPVALEQPTDVAATTATEPSAPPPVLGVKPVVSAKPENLSKDDRAYLVHQEWLMNKQAADKLKPGDPGFDEAVRNMALTRQELMQQYGVDPVRTPLQATPSIAQAAPAVNAPPFINQPAAAAAKEGAKGMAESYVKDYDTVQQAAQSAEAQLQTFNNLEKIKPNTNALANTQQVIGSIFQALGQDPNSKMIQDAVKTRDANLIISQLKNAGLRAEKGVQTRSDEVRIADEFPKTTDFQQVWNFSVKLGKERAQRTLDQRDYFDNVAAANNGTPFRARQLWNKEMANDPLTQYLGGKLIFRSDFIKAYTAKHPDLGTKGAIQVWREMEQDYQSRGGKK